MKNPMAIMAAIAAGFAGILSGKAQQAWELRRDPHGRPKRRRGHVEGIAKGPSYNKSILRLYARSKHVLSRVDPAKPTATTVRSNDGRSAWRIWSDGSYRKMVATKGRRIIPV